MKSRTRVDWIGFRVLLLAVCGTWMTAAVMAEQAKAPQAKGVVVLSNISGAHGFVVERSLKMVRTYGQLDAQIVASDVKLAKSMKAQAAEYAGKSVANEAFRVLFVLLKDDPVHAQFDPGKKLLVVNLGPLQSEDKEVFSRRVERQVMRGLFYYAGRSPCPNPQCCLWNYKDLEQLDGIGRGPCPPCLVRGREQLMKQGFGTLFGQDPKARETEKK